MVLFDRINKDTAFPVSGYSSGNEKNRVNLKIETRTRAGLTEEQKKTVSNLMKVHCDGIINPNDGSGIKLSLFDRFRWTAIMVKDANGHEQWLKVNKESLRKRLGMGRIEFSKNIVDGKFNSDQLEHRLKALTNAQVNLKDMLSKLKDELNYYLNPEKAKIDESWNNYDIKGKFQHTINLLLENKNLHPVSKKAIEQIDDEAKSLNKIQDRNALLTKMMQLLNKCEEKLRGMEGSP